MRSRAAARGTPIGRVEKLSTGWIGPPVVLIVPVSKPETCGQPQVSNWCWPYWLLETMESHISA